MVTFKDTTTDTSADDSLPGTPTTTPSTIHPSIDSSIPSSPSSSLVISKSASTSLSNDNGILPRQESTGSTKSAPDRVPSGTSRGGTSRGGTSRGGTSRGTQNSPAHGINHGHLQRAATSRHQTSNTGLRGWFSMLYSSLVFDLKQNFHAFIIAVGSLVVILPAMYLADGGKSFQLVPFMKTLELPLIDPFGMPVLAPSFLLFRLIYALWELDCLRIARSASNGKLGRGASSVSRGGDSAPKTSGWRPLSLSLLRLSLWVFELAAIFLIFSQYFSSSSRISSFVYLSGFLLTTFIGKSIHAIVLTPSLFLFAPSIHGLVLPTISAIIVMFPLAAMCAYAWTLWYYENNPWVQSFIIGCIYPLGVIVYKQFMLGKYGGPFLFGRKVGKEGVAVNMNEQWFQDDVTKNMYTSIVRSIHGMYFPQSVGLFLLYANDSNSFYGACVMRLVTQSLIKVVTFAGDEKAVISGAKKDGVYDFEADFAPRADPNSAVREWKEGQEEGGEELEDGEGVPMIESTMSSGTDSTSVPSSGGPTGAYSSGTGSGRRRSTGKARTRSARATTPTDSLAAAMDQGLYNDTLKVEGEDKPEPIKRSMEVVEEDESSDGDDGGNEVETIHQDVDAPGAVSIPEFGQYITKPDNLQADDGDLGISVRGRKSTSAPPAASKGGTFGKLTGMTGTGTWGSKKGRALANMYDSGKGSALASMYGNSDAAPSNSATSATTASSDESPKTPKLTKALTVLKDGVFNPDFENSDKNRIVDSEIPSTFMKAHPLKELKLEKKVNYSLALFLAACKDVSLEKWTAVGKTSQGVQTYLKDKIERKGKNKGVADKLTTYKSICEIRGYNPSNVFRYMCMSGGTFGKGKNGVSQWSNVVHVVSDYHVILHETVEFPAPYRNRDVVVHQVGVLLPDKSFLILRCNCDDYSSYCKGAAAITVTPKAMLASMKLGGFYLHKTEGVSKCTSVTAFNSMDFKGTVSASVIKNVAMTFSGDKLMDVYETFRKEKLWPTSSNPLGEGEREMLQDCLAQHRLAKTSLASQANFGVFLNDDKDKTNYSEWTSLAMERDTRLSYRFAEGARKGGGVFEVYSEFAVWANATTVASDIAFAKSSDDPPTFLEAKSGHSLLWHSMVRINNSDKDREVVSLQVRHELADTGGFVICTIDADHHKHPMHGTKKRAFVKEGFVIEPMSNDKCKVRRHVTVNLKSISSRDVVTKYIKKFYGDFMLHMTEQYLSKREQNRVQEILKAREDLADIPWRDTLHPYTEEEEVMVERAMNWLDSIELNGGTSKWRDVEENDDEDVIMRRKSVDVTKIFRKKRRTAVKQRVEAHVDPRGQHVSHDTTPRTPQSGSNGGRFGDLMTSIGNTLRSSRNPSQEFGREEEEVVFTTSRSCATNRSTSSGQSKGGAERWIFPVLSQISKLKDEAGDRSGTVVGTVASSFGLKKLFRRMFGRSDSQRQEEAMADAMVENSVMLVGGTFRKEVTADGASGARLVEDEVSELPQVKKAISKLGVSMNKVLSGGGDDDGKKDDDEADDDEADDDEADGDEADDEFDRMAKSGGGMSTGISAQVSRLGALVSANSRPGMQNRMASRRASKFQSARNLLELGTSAEAGLTKKEADEELDRQMDDMYEDTYMNTKKGMFNAGMFNTGMFKTTKLANKVGMLTDEELSELSERGRPSGRVSIRAEKSVNRLSFTGFSQGGGDAPRLSATMGLATKLLGVSDAGVENTSQPSKREKPHQKMVHFGYCRTDIDLPPGLVKAWMADDYHESGIREMESRDNLRRRKFETFNDHSYVDYRRSVGLWPVRDRESILYHINMDVETTKETEGAEESDKFINATFSCDHEDAIVGEGGAIMIHFSSVTRIVANEKGGTDVTYLFCVLDDGQIPSWILQQRTKGILSNVTMCKKQLDNRALAAKMTTFNERMHQLKMRMGVKWNEEAIVEKILLILCLPVCMFLFYDSDNNQQNADLVRAFVILCITETLSDCLMVVVCKKKLDIDIGGAQTWEEAGFRNWRTLVSCVIASCAPAMCCIAAFMSGFLEQNVQAAAEAALPVEESG